MARFASNARVTPLAGTASATATVGPFVPLDERPIWVTLSGAWTGAVQLRRSTDGGVTKLPLTAAGQAYGGYTANANEAVVEDSCADATYYLAVALTSGAVAYRVAQ